MSQKQKIAAICVLLMASLGIFTGHKPVKMERFAEHEHTEIEKPNLVTCRRGLGVDSGAVAVVV